MCGKFLAQESILELFTEALDNCEQRLYKAQVNADIYMTYLWKMMIHYSDFFH